jgi:hypothetical protein
MKTRIAFLSAPVFILAAAFLLPSSAEAQRGGRTSGGGARTAQNRPRANQGHIPPPPAARSNPSEGRQAEHLPTGHVNEVPHVNHNLWFGHEQPGDARFHMDKPFAQGRFAHSGVKYRYQVTRIDANRHQFWFPGGRSFEVASWDWPLCSDWCWDCGDDFVVYDDADHPGWYLLYNVHTGVYVHAQYMGM